MSTVQKWILWIFAAAIVIGVGVLPLLAAVRTTDTGEVIVKNTATNYTATQVVDMITDYGSREVTFLFDGKRDWIWEQDVTFPTNISVLVVPGTRISPSNGVTVNLANVPLLSGPWEIFAGDGVVTGNATFLYRYAEWGAPSYYVGLGLLGTTNFGAMITTNNSYVMANSTTSTLDGLVYETGIGGTITVYKITSTTNVSAMLDADEIIVGGTKITPNSGTTTITLSSNMSDSVIQTNIDAQTKFVPAGTTLRFQFSNGNYTSLYDSINFLGFYGGGNIQIYGEGWDTAANDSQHTNQGVYLDFSLNDAGPGIVCSGPGAGQYRIRNLRIKAAPANTLDGPIDLNNCRALVDYCYLDGPNTNTGVSIAAQNVYPLGLTQNYFERLSAAMRAELSYIYSESNSVIGTAPNGGYWLRSGSYMTGFDKIQPTGTTYSVLLQEGSTNVVVW